MESLSQFSGAKRWLGSDDARAESFDTRSALVQQPPATNDHL